MFDLKIAFYFRTAGIGNGLLELSIAWFLVVFGSSKHWNYVPWLTLNMQGAGSGKPVKNLAVVKGFAY